MSGADPKRRLERLAASLSRLAPERVEAFEIWLEEQEEHDDARQTVRAPSGRTEG